MRIVKAKNTVIPAYPQVHLSPATLEMLASRPSVMKPRAEVAAHLLSPDHASWPGQPTRGVVTPGRRESVLDEHREKPSQMP